MHAALTTLDINCKSLKVLWTYVHNIKTMMLKILRLRKEEQMQEVTADFMIVIAFDELAEDLS